MTVLLVVAVWLGLSVSVGIGIGRAIRIADDQLVSPDPIYVPQEWLA